MLLQARWTSLPPENFSLNSKWLCLWGKNDFLKRIFIHINNFVRNRFFESPFFRELRQSHCKSRMRTAGGFKKLLETDEFFFRLCVDSARMSRGFNWREARVVRWPGAQRLRIESESGEVIKIPELRPFQSRQFFPTTSPRCMAASCERSSVE